MWPYLSDEVINVEDVPALSRDCENASTLREPDITMLAGHAERQRWCAGEKHRPRRSNARHCGGFGLSPLYYRHCWSREPTCSATIRCVCRLVDVAHHYWLTGSSTMQQSWDAATAFTLLRRAVADGPTQSFDRCATPADGHAEAARAHEAGRRLGPMRASGHGKEVVTQ